MRLKDADAMKSALYQSWGYNSLVAEICEFVDKQPTVNEWISVKDELPEDEYECLVVNKSGGYWIGWFKADEERWVIDGTICGDGYVTHWMPLPEPPKGDENSDDE